MSRILTAVCFTFCVVCVTVSNSGVHAGKKFSMQNEEYMNISIILSVFANISCAIKYADSNRKNCARNKIHNLSCGVAAVSTSFYQIHY